MFAVAGGIILAVLILANLEAILRLGFGAIKIIFSIMIIACVIGGALYIQSENRSKITKPQQIPTQVEASDLKIKEKIDPVFALAEKVFNETGVRIVHLNANGEEIPLNSFDHLGVYALKRGKNTLFKDDGTNMYVNFEGVYSIADEKLILVSFASGGNGCNATYRLLIMKSDAPVITSELGNCSEPDIKVDDKQLILTFFEGYGHRLETSYSNKKMHSRKYDLPFIKNVGSDGPTFGYLNDVDDLEKILTDEKLANGLISMMGKKNFEDLKTRLDVHGKSGVHDKFLISGLARHSGGSDEAIIYGSHKNSDLIAAILRSDFDATNDKINREIEVFSNRPAMLTIMPDEIKVWIKAFGNTSVKWHYSDQ